MIKITTITGNVKQFKGMFEKIMCGNRYPLFSEVILEISNGMISINGIDQTRAVGTNQEYMGFIIDGDNNIPVNTVSTYEAIKLFNDNDSLKFTYEDNKIILSVENENKHDTITIPTLKLNEINISPIKFTENSIITNEDEMKFDGNIVIDVSHIKNQIKRAGFVNNLYHEYIISINEDTNEVELIVGDPTNYEISSKSIITIDNVIGTVKSQYAYGYEDIFKTLSGEVIINMSDAKPMLITQTTDEYRIKYLMAPSIPQ